MTPSQARRMRVAVEAAVLLGPTSEKTKAAIEEHQRAYAARREARAADITVRWDGVERRSHEQDALLLVRWNKQERRKFTGEAQTAHGTLSS